MADLAYRNDLALAGRSRCDWGAIWAGVFAFSAIWAVFELLGEAIFASAANPAQPVSGMSVGMGIWSIVLTIIAMYVGGRVTGHFARFADRADATMHGLVMFGLSVISAVVIVTLAGAALSGGTGVNASTHVPYALTGDLGWIGFIALFLGWLAAMGGAASATRAVVARTDVREMRPAA